MLNEKQIAIAKDIGKEYQANLPHIKMGDVRKSLAYDVFELDKWGDLSSAQRDEVMIFFQEGVDIEQRYAKRQ